MDACFVTKFTDIISELLITTVKEDVHSYSEKFHQHFYGIFTCGLFFRVNKPSKYLLWLYENPNLKDLPHLHNDKLIRSPVNACCIMIYRR